MVSEGVKTHPNLQRPAAQGMNSAKNPTHEVKVLGNAKHHNLPEVINSFGSRRNGTEIKEPDNDSLKKSSDVFNVVRAGLTRQD